MAICSMVSADLPDCPTFQFTTDGTRVAMKFAGNPPARPAVRLPGHNQATFVRLKLLVVTSNDILVMGHEDISFLVRGDLRIGLRGLFGPVF
ncbi:hypothetical protein BIZ32_01585 [Lactiplantibacillus plantarum]|nr:hypothetical protein BIZ32_01585 [Lactiplantibacillus plantarum]